MMLSLLFAFQLRATGRTRGLRWLSGGDGDVVVDSVVGRLEVSLRQDCGVKDGDTLLALISGGSDSTALAHLLHLTQASWSPPLRIEVLTFDHQLRPESRADADFVERLCERLGFAYHVRRATWGAEDRPTQARTRAWRRAAAVDVLETITAGEPEAARRHVVLAHHHDDQTETALLRLARGARLTKVFDGMQPRSDPCFVRPLLWASKSELTEWLVERGEGWVEDASNLDPSKYKRNAARLGVVPPLEALAGGGDALRRRLDGLRRQAAAVEAWTCAEADAYEATHLKRGKLGLRGYAAAPEPVRLELLARAAHRGQKGALQLSYALLLDLDDLCRAESKSQSWNRALPGCGAVIRRRHDYLDSVDAAASARRVGGPARADVADVSIDLPDGRWLAEGRRGAPPSKPPAAGGWALALRGVPAGARLEVRFRRDGDRFHPHWRRDSLKLKDFLRAQRVPYDERDETPLLAGGDGALFAVLSHPPHVASQAAAPAAETDEDVLWIHVTPPGLTPATDGDDDEDDDL
ncbi:hypothetical protein M885DRAFT_627036 [Pelagophyceae sp. CCMP2097]|nr:hypothetical protein M885DRAFT_627036 [Pelagophyceae sp. CCMP2097]